MTMDELEAELTRYRYKPRSTLRVEDFQGLPAIVLRVETVDSRNPDSRLWLPSRHMIGVRRLEQMTVPSLKREVRGMASRLELHELDEWLSYDGELINDPHAPLDRTEGPS